MFSKFRGVHSLDDIKARCSVDNNSCWIWQGSKCGPGYGQAWYVDRKHVTHRLSYLFSKGEIPEGLEVDHICNVRLCQNPDHLRLVTHQENIDARELNRKACKKGHPWIDINIRTLKSGARICYQCALIRANEWRHRNPEKSKQSSRKYYHSVTKIRNADKRLSRLSRTI